MKEKATEAFKQENFQNALDIYNEALDLTPPDEVTDIAIFHNNMGVCYQKLKNNGEAKKAFSKALEIKPDYVKPRAFRMNLLKSEEEFEQALEDAKKIDELDHSYPGIHKTI